MKIYIYDRDGREWADFNLPPKAKVIRVLECDSRKDVEKHLKRENGRIAAILERARDELPVEVKQSFLGRLKSLFWR